MSNPIPPPPPTVGTVGDPLAAPIPVSAHLDTFQAAVAGDFVNLDAALVAQPTLVREFAPDGHTLLGLAARHGHTDVVARLLAAGANPRLGQTGPGGLYPIHEAAAHGHTAVVAQLLAAGADPNEPDDHDRTPLHYAADRADGEMVLALIDAGGRSGLYDRDGLTALDRAENRLRPDIANRLAETSVGDARINTPQS